MTALSQTILDHYQVRKTARQKEAFRAFLCQALAKHNIPCRVETLGRYIKSHNIIIGHPQSSDYIITAHYDTSPELPFPNLIFPKNILGNVLFGLVILAVTLFIRNLIFIGLVRLLPAVVALPLSVIILLGMLFWVIKGKANPNTANDNTSGVISLLEILHRIDLNQTPVSFILFDNEEIGLFGSSAFAKQHRELIKHQTVINFDCVSDGDDIFLVQSKAARPEVEHRLSQTVTADPQKTVHLTTARSTLFPSDQWNFPKHIGVFAAQKMPILGYYIPRLHTRRDTVFDQANIALLADGFSRFIQPDSE